MDHYGPNANMGESKLFVGMIPKHSSEQVLIPPRRR